MRAHERRRSFAPLLAALIAVGCGGGEGGDGDDDAGADTGEDTLAADAAGDDGGGSDVPGDTQADTATDTAMDTDDGGELDAATDTAMDTDDGGELDAAGEDGAGESLRFAHIECLPDVLGGADVVDGQLLTCEFSVLGEAGRNATLSCEDTGGGAVDCSSTSSTQIQPFGANPLPIDSGWFGAPSDGLAGMTYEIVWVADDGTDEATYHLTANVIADDGVDEQPSIEVSCHGDDDGEVSVTAGDRLECTLFFLDPDPDTVSWDYTRSSGPSPVDDPSPFGGLGGAPYSVEWHWDTDATESGGTWIWTFSVNDDTGPDVTYDLTVHVA
jgi:hypothetical protein